MKECRSSTPGRDKPEVHPLHCPPAESDVHGGSGDSKPSASCLRLCRSSPSLPITRTFWNGLKINTLHLDPCSGFCFGGTQVSPGQVCEFRGSPKTPQFTRCLPSSVHSPAHSSRLSTCCFTITDSFPLRPRCAQVCSQNDRRRSTLSFSGQFRFGLLARVSVY